MFKFVVLFLIASVSICLNSYAQPVDELCDTHFQTGECITVNWQKFPTETDFGTFVFNTLQTKLAMTVRVFMPSMGVGSSPVAVSKIGNGIYRASNIYFSEHGAWQIIFEIKKNSQVVDTAILPYQF